MRAVKEAGITFVGYPHVLEGLLHSLFMVALFGDMRRAAHAEVGSSFFPTNVIHAFNPCLVWTQVQGVH